MAYINSNYLKLKAGYLFPEIGRRVKAFAAANPGAKIIRMGIGDVTEPLPGAVVEAMHKAVDEMGRWETFRGYGPEQGYEFLRQAIVAHDYFFFAPFFDFTSPNSFRASAGSFFFATRIALTARAIFLRTRRGSSLPSAAFSTASFDTPRPSPLGFSRLSSP